MRQGLRLAAVLRENLEFRDSIPDFDYQITELLKHIPYAFPGDRHSIVVDRLRVHDFCGYTRHATALDHSGWRRRGERGRSQLAEADLRARCKAEAHLFHEQPAPYAACNRRGTHIGSLILPVSCLVAPLHRPRSSRKPAPRESACFVAAHAGPRVATISRFTIAVEIGERSPMVRRCYNTLRKRIEREACVYPNSLI